MNGRTRIHMLVTINRDCGRFEGRLHVHWLNFKVRFSCGRRRGRSRAAMARIPEICADGSFEYQLRAAPGSAWLLSDNGLATSVLTHNGALPVPVLRLRLGGQVRMVFGIDNVPGLAQRGPDHLNAVLKSLGLWLAEDKARAVEAVDIGAETHASVFCGPGR